MPDSAAYMKKLLAVRSTVITNARSSFGSAIPSGGQPPEVLNRT